MGTPDPRQVALLNAAAAGGTDGLARAQAEQAAAAAAPPPISAALAQAVGTQGLTPDATSQLAGIEAAPAAAMNARGTATLGANNAYLYDLAKLYRQFMDTQNDQVLPAIYRDLALGGSSGGGSGGSGGDSGGRSKGSSSNAPKTGDWLKAARVDAGLVGSGVRSKDGLPPFLRAASKANAQQNPGAEASIAMALPRDLRARAYAESTYGADQSNLDKGMPVGGFLEKALLALQQTIKDKQSYEAYAKATKARAAKLKGDQSKAVQYALMVARANLQSGVNPLAKAGGIVGGAPSSVSGSIKKALGGLF